MRPLAGATLSFSRTQTEGSSKGDPRQPIEERYPSKEAYLARVREATEGLVSEGYVLEGDLEWVVSQASERWDAIVEGS